MKASPEFPTYKVYVVAGEKKYNITTAVEGLTFSDQKNQIAQRSNIQLHNQQEGSSRLSDLIPVCSRVVIYANDGSKEEEVFRGFVWARSNKSALDSRSLELKCYDNLIYLQESDDSLYFEPRQWRTYEIFNFICQKWGIKCQFDMALSIIHGKLVLRGKLADILTTDLLDSVKAQTGRKPIILGIKDELHVKQIGTNSTVYRFLADKNTLSTSSTCTMDGMVTKVIIMAKADSDDRESHEATVKGDTSTYGTIQKIVDRDESMSMADAKKEAQTIIDENGAPKWEYELQAPNNPWIRKGDKIYVNAGDLTGYYIVTGIDRSIDNKKSTMTLSLEKA